MAESLGVCEQPLGGVQDSKMVVWSVVLPGQWNRHKAKSKRKVIMDLNIWLGADRTTDCCVLSISDSYGNNVWRVRRSLLDVCVCVVPPLSTWWRLELITLDVTTQMHRPELDLKPVTLSSEDTQVNSIHQTRLVNGMRPWNDRHVLGEDSQFAFTEVNIDRIGFEVVVESVCSLSNSLELITLSASQEDWSWSRLVFFVVNSFPRSSQNFQ